MDALSLGSRLSQAAGPSGKERGREREKKEGEKKRGENKVWSGLKFSLSFLNS